MDGRPHVLDLKTGPPCLTFCVISSGRDCCWRCFLRSGKARTIGVSNFPTALWKRALELAPVPVNQVEFHPVLAQGALVDFARERELQLVA